MRFGGPGPLQLRTLQRSAPAVGSTLGVDDPDRSSISNSRCKRIEWRLDRSRL